MDMEKSLKESLSRFDTWYDVAAFCYDNLIDLVGDQELFIGRYILFNECAENKNPNLDKLRVFESKSNMIIHKYSFDVERGIQKILGLMYYTRNELDYYGDTELNQATLLYFLLAAIDRYAASVRNMRHAPAPLNYGYKEKSYIYFASPKSLIYEAAIALEFRDVITDKSIKHCLTNLCVLEVSECKGLKEPKLVTLSFNINSELPSVLYEDEYQKNKDSVLKVALIPFLGKDKTDFHVTSGVNFKVKYSGEYISFAVKRAIGLLEKAIDSKANIIVFPEYMCAPEVQSEIGNFLASLYVREPERLKETILVMAGSGWTEDDNNIMQIFDRCGVRIGTYYKYSKFNKEGYIEGLSEPGKECTIIDVMGLGRILPSICRDVSNEDYTKRLVDSFNPFLLITSAWSSSVNGGFKNQYDALAKRYQVTSLLCNCCEAIRPKSEISCVARTVNLIAIPFKECSICATDFFELQRNESCYKNCEKYQCMFIVSANFSKECVENRQVIFPRTVNIHL